MTPVQGAGRGRPAVARDHVEPPVIRLTALPTLAPLLAVRDESAAGNHAARAERATASSHARFRFAGRRHLADAIDGRNGADRLPPSDPIFARSLAVSPLGGAKARSVHGAVGLTLLTRCGRGSLLPDAPGYGAVCGGDPVQRDRAHHSGTVWAWLGPYPEAHFRVYGDRAAPRVLLQPMEHHLRDAGVGAISEIFDGDLPHQPQGSIAQAWRVAEALRVWRMLMRD